jgi:hypothetical protein
MDRRVASPRDQCRIEIPIPGVGGASLYEFIKLCHDQSGRSDQAMIVTKGSLEGSVGLTDAAM